MDTDYLTAKYTNHTKVSPALVPRPSDGRGGRRPGEGMIYGRGEVLRFRSTPPLSTSTAPRCRFIFPVWLHQNQPPARAAVPFHPAHACASGHKARTMRRRTDTILRPSIRSLPRDAMLRRQNRLTRAAKSQLRLALVSMNFQKCQIWREYFRQQKSGTFKLGQPINGFFRGVGGLTKPRRKSHDEIILNPH